MFSVLTKQLVYWYMHTITNQHLYLAYAFVSIMVSICNLLRYISLVFVKNWITYISVFNYRAISWAVLCYIWTVYMYLLYMYGRWKVYSAICSHPTMRKVINKSFNLYSRILLRHKPSHIIYVLCLVFQDKPI